MDLVIVLVASVGFAGGALGFAAWWRAQEIEKRVRALEIAVTPSEAETSPYVGDRRKVLTDSAVGEANEGASASS